MTFLKFISTIRKIKLIELKSHHWFTHKSCIMYDLVTSSYSSSSMNQREKYVDFSIEKVILII